jgi:hypothetical protein
MAVFRGLHPSSLWSVCSITLRFFVNFQPSVAIDNRQLTTDEKLGCLSASSMFKSLARVHIKNPPVGGFEQSSAEQNA